MKDNLFCTCFIALTGAPLAIHPGRDPLAPFEILDILEQAGADISRTVMCHLDRTFFKDEDYIRLAQRGCYLSLDQFGIEISHYQVSMYLKHNVAQFYISMYVA